MSNGLEKIWVQASKSKKNRGRVACHEYDTAHVTPENQEGLLDISPCSESDEGYEPHYVAGTTYVYDCIRAGRLEKIPEPSLEVRKALDLAADKKIGIALARQEIAEEMERATLEIAAAEAVTTKAKAATAKANARKARAEEKKAKAEAVKAEAEGKKAKAGS